MYTVHCENTLRIEAIECITLYAMIGYANHIMIIFLSINLNVRNERKNVIKLRGCTYKITHIVAANILRLPHLVRT